MDALVAYCSRRIPPISAIKFSGAARVIFPSLPYFSLVTKKIVEFLIQLWKRNVEYISLVRKFFMFKKSMNYYSILIFYDMEKKYNWRDLSYTSTHTYHCLFFISHFTPIGHWIHLPLTRYHSWVIFGSRSKRWFWKNVEATPIYCLQWI
jgi:hypothetical protein